MAKLPATPPSTNELRELGAETRRVSTDDVLLRIYRRGGEHPTNWDTFRNFGPLNARFDHHPDSDTPKNHPGHAIYYAATHLTTCLAEVFQDTRVINTARRVPWLVAFEPSRPLELLDLTGTWPTRAGASMKINTGPRPYARTWSRGFYEAFRSIDGIVYPSSMHANEPAVALYERARDTLPEQPLDQRPLRDPALLGDIKRSAVALNYDVIL